MTRVPHPIPARGVLPPYDPVGPVFMPTPRFDVLVVDPPWSYGKLKPRKRRGGRGGQAAMHYRTMEPGSGEGRSRNAAKHYVTVGQDGSGEINRRTGAGVQAIIDCVPMADLIADDAHLYLWTTNPKLPFAFAVMEAWGFTYKTTLTWVKIRKDGGVARNGMGWFYRGCTEHVLFGVRGRKPIPSALRQPNVVHAQRGAHSVKPDAVYALVDAVSVEAPYKLDVFARGEPRPGWWAWGDEVIDPMEEVGHGE